MTLLHKESDLKLIKQDTQGPCVLTHLAIQIDEKSRDFHLVLINGHLAPFKGGDPKRFEQVSEALYQAHLLCPLADAVIVTRDMNMREHETVPLCNHLNLVDGWVAAGRPRRHQYTCDTHRNIYYENGFEYKARYDRVMWTRSSRLSLRQGGLQVIDRPPSYEDTHHFFSDHFGLLVQFDLRDTPL